MALPMRPDRSQTIPFEPRRPDFDPWWDPFRQIDETLGRMGQLLEGVTEGRGRWGWPWPAWSGGLLADVEETEDAYVVEVELPGVRAEDLDIEVREDRLWIRGEVKERERTGEERHQSWYHGRFEHVLPLPPSTEPDRIEATLSDGLLTVRIPKAESAASRHIEVRQI